jgi:hypothetical protein
LAFTVAALQDNAVLIIGSNPTSVPPPVPEPTTGPEFSPDVVHRINIVLTAGRLREKVS